MTSNNIEDKIDSFSEGDLDHAAEIISALWRTITRNEGIKAPSNASFPVSAYFLPHSMRYDV